MREFGQSSTSDMVPFFLFLFFSQFAPRKAYFWTTGKKKFMFLVSLEEWFVMCPIHSHVHMYCIYKCVLEYMYENMHISMYTRIYITYMLLDMFKNSLIMGKKFSQLLPDRDGSIFHQSLCFWLSRRCNPCSLEKR